jgi:hypothetical protein
MEEDMRLFIVNKAFDQFPSGDVLRESERQPRGDQDREYTCYLTSINDASRRVGVRPIDIEAYTQNGTLKELPETFQIDDGQDL